MASRAARWSLPRARIAAQRLVGPPLDSAAAVVRWMGAVQAQDYDAARWALALRCGLSASEIDSAFDAGAFVRTHVMRPTWHLVPSEDIRELLHLTASRVQMAIQPRLRALGFDARTAGRAMDVMSAELTARGPLMRTQLSEALQGAGIAHDNLALMHLLGAAELDLRVISGPRRGRQFTYALFEQRVPAGGTFDAQSARRALALRYFRSHGPATSRDFAWWSGLTMRDVRSALIDAGSELRALRLDGETVWRHVETPAEVGGDSAHLLRNFDEYTVGYRDRSALMSAVVIDRSHFAFGSELSNVVIADGSIIGGWRRVLSARDVRIELRIPGVSQPLFAGGYCTLRSCTRCTSADRSR